MNREETGAPHGNVPASQGDTPAPDGYKWRVLTTVIFGIFMVILDTTVVNVAFQALREEFGGDISSSQWILSIYVLALGITTPLAGFLAERFGSKKIYLGGLSLFIVGSLLSGLAGSLPMLIAARAIQGMGGGIAMPLGTALLLQAFPPREQGMALGVFGIAALVAPALGPVLGGWLVDQGLWRVIFFINPPVGLVGVILGMRFLRERRSPDRKSWDVWGIVTEVIGFGSILYAASIAANRGWSDPQVLLFFALGGVGLLAFVFVELKIAQSPLLDLRLFLNRVFLNASVLGYVSTVALFGAEFLMPVYLQSLRGKTALETGIILLPMALTGGIMVTISGRIYDRIGPRVLLGAGFTLLIVNTWQLAQIRADTPISWILFLLALRGMSLGMIVQTTMVTALSVVPTYEIARGSALTNATRLVVQSIGVAVLATVLVSTLSPEIRAAQTALEQSAPAHSVAKGGLCEAPAVASTADSGLRSAALSNSDAPRLQGSGPAAGGLAALKDRACQENVAGFERAYHLTFYAAILALVLGLLLPGWPGKWEGRQAAGGPPAPAH